MCFVLVLCSLFSAFVLNKWCCSCDVGGSKQKQSVVLSHQGGEVRGSPLISACGPLGKCEVDKRVKRVFGENPTNMLIKDGSLLCGRVEGHVDIHSASDWSKGVLAWLYLRWYFCTWEMRPYLVLPNGPEMQL